jgi:hypothetical protein
MLTHELIDCDMNRFLEVKNVSSISFLNFLFQNCVIVQIAQKKFPHS